VDTLKETKANLYNCNKRSSNHSKSITSIERRASPLKWIWNSYPT